MTTNRFRFENLHRRKAALVAVAALLVGACSQAQPASVAISPAVESSPPSTVAATNAPDPLAAFTASLDRTIAASSYRFQAAVNAETVSGSVSLELSGWVNGDDRQLVTKSGNMEMTTVVEGGVATVTTPSGSTEVPLTEAQGTPSLLLLRDLQNIEIIAPGEVAGTMPGQILQGSGLSDGTLAGSGVTATVTYDPGGMLTGYVLEDDAKTWRMTVRIYDVGGI